MSSTREPISACAKGEHSRKPDEQYAIIEACSEGPYLELFARGRRDGWTSWGAEADDGYRPSWKTYAFNSAAVVAELVPEIFFRPIFSSRRWPRRGRGKMCRKTRGTRYHGPA